MIIVDSESSVKNDRSIKKMLCLLSKEKPFAYDQYYNEGVTSLPRLYADKNLKNSLCQDSISSLNNEENGVSVLDSLESKRSLN